jgi:hypothetical protein
MFLGACPLDAAKIITSAEHTSDILCVLTQDEKPGSCPVDSAEYITYMYYDDGSKTIIEALFF